MKILYLDTSSSFLYTAILEDSNIIKEIKEKLDNNLSVFTLSKIHEMLDSANIDINEIEKIIAVNGPGSFTGIRIGLTIAKTLAWAKNIPIIPISSLEAMSLSAGEDYNYIVPTIDARRGFVYASIYDNENDKFIMNEKYLSMNVLLVALSNIEVSITFISNDKLNVEYMVKTYDPDISKIVFNTMNRESVNPHSIDANYLKLTEAEENKLKKENE
jgi:tRNA threonylcarbamoyl adenosine modification protein YeaZ